MEQFIEFIVNHQFLVATLVCLVVLLVFTESKRAGKSLSTQAIINLMNNEGAAVVDVRDESEYNNGHIVDSVNIPFATLKERTTELDKYKGKPIIVVCNIGQSSGAAGKTLGSAGFEQVFRLAGGVSGWKGEGLPLVKS